MMSHKLYGPGIQGESGGRVWIGIDQSYSGFAVTVLNEASYSTVVTKFQGKGADRLSDIYAYLRDFLIDVKKEAEIVDVAIEGYAYGSQMANMLGELGENDMAFRSHEDIDTPEYDTRQQCRCGLIQLDLAFYCNQDITGNKD